MMLKIRMVEETIAEKYPEQEMRCPVHLSIGQEAVAAGVCAALTNDDVVMSTHRAHAHYLAKGGDLPAMISEIYGKATGCCSGKGGSMHLVDLRVNMLGSTPIVGSSLPVGVGTAFGFWLKGEKRISTVFLGDGTTEEGVFFESLNFAALKKLPVLFICENNLYSVYSPLAVRQPIGRDLVSIAQAHGMAADRGDGNQVEEVHRMTAQAVARARAGQGPTFLEFATYRWREHCGPYYDNDLGYRTEAEYLSWKAKCPVENYERQLLQSGLLTETEVAAIKTKLRQEIDAAFQFAKKSPFPSGSTMNVPLYAEEIKQ